MFPKVFRNEILKQLHRSYVYWPSIDIHIEELVKNCDSRALTSKSPIKFWPTPDGPWERVHIDYAGPFMGKYFLVMVDAYSKLSEIFESCSTQVQKL